MRGARTEKRKRKRDKCRVEGEIYLPAARADKIIRQKMPGVDDGEAEEGSRRKKSGEESRDLSGKNEERKRERERRGNERWRDRPVRSGRMGEEPYCSGCCGARNGRKGTKGAGRRPEKEETGQECTDECVVLRATQPQRLSCERMSEFSLESLLRIDSIGYRDSWTVLLVTREITAHYISVIYIYRNIEMRTRAVCLSTISIEK